MEPGILWLCAEQESYLLVDVCSRAVSMYIFCSAWKYPRVDVVGGVSFGFARYYCSQCGKLFECEFCCLKHRRKVNALCLLYKIYHTVDHFMDEYLKHFVAVRNTRAPAALGELVLVIPSCRIDQFNPCCVTAYCCSSMELASVRRV